MTTLTYAEIGATQREPLPRRYNHLRHRTRIGEGPEVFARAAEAVLTFRMHSAAGARIRTDAERAAHAAFIETLGPNALWRTYLAERPSESTAA